MKKLSAFFLLGVLYLTACKKSDGSGGGNTSATFTATVNGKETTFDIFQATLIRSTTFNEKRMDIGGISQDKSKRLILTLGIETAQGNGMTVKPYVLNAFPEDDPGTPDVDESLTTQGFSTYSTSLGNNNWFTDVYNEDGLFTVTACDSANTIVSGTFQTTLRDFNTDTTVLSVTNGKLTSVKYLVGN